MQIAQELSVNYFTLLTLQVQNQVSQHILKQLETWQCYEGSWTKMMDLKVCAMKACVYLVVAIQNPSADIFLGSNSRILFWQSLSMVLNRSHCATGGPSAAELGQGAGTAGNGELSPGL